MTKDRTYELLEMNTVFVLMVIIGILWLPTLKITRLIGMRFSCATTVVELTTRIQEEN